MKSQMTVARKFGAACAVLVFLTVLLGVVAISNVGGIQRNLLTVVDGSLPSVYQISMLDSEVFELRGNYWKHIAATDGQARAAVEQSNQDLQRKIQATFDGYAKTISEPEDRQLFDAIKTPYGRYLAAWEQVAPLSRAGNAKEATACYLSVADPVHAELKRAIRALVDWNRKNGDRNAALAMASVAQTRSWSWSLLAMSVGLGMLLAWLVIRSVNRRCASP